MAGTNLFQPNGFSIARPNLGMAPNYQGNIFWIKRGYTLNIGMGDVVKTLTSGDPNGGGQGYIGLANPNDPNILGIFNGIAGMGTFGNLAPGLYDTNLQGLNFGLNGSYQSTILPPAGQDIAVYIHSDQTATFKVQYNGTWTAMVPRGQNITFAGNGAPNSAGRSTAYIASPLGTSSALPFRVVGSFGLIGGPQDPSAANPWLEVMINTSENVNPAGI